MLSKRKPEKNDHETQVKKDSKEEELVIKFREFLSQNKPPTLGDYMKDI